MRIDLKVNEDMGSFKNVQGGETFLCNWELYLKFSSAVPAVIPHNSENRPDLYNAVCLSNGTCASFSPDTVVEVVKTVAVRDLT